MVFLDDTDAATGRRAIRMAGWSNNLWLGRIRLSRWPIVTMDYQAPPGMDPYLGVALDGIAPLFSLVPSHPKAPPEVPHPFLWNNDGAWRHSAIPFRKLKTKSSAAETTMVFMRQSAVNARQGPAIDNFCIGSLRKGVEFFWQPPPDASGIAGYSVLLNASANASPPLKINCPAARHVVQKLDSPTLYLHVRACDAAGNWGAVGRVVVRVSDLTEP